MNSLIYKITPPPLLRNLSFLNITYPVIPNSASDISGVAQDSVIPIICLVPFLHLVYFVYFAIRQFYYSLFRLNLIYADSKFEVRFVPAGQDFELDILAPFTNDRLAVICYFTYDFGLH